MEARYPLYCEPWVARAAQQIPSTWVTNSSHLVKKVSPLRAGDSVPHRTEVNMQSRILKMALAVTLFFLLTGASYAQSPWWGSQGNGAWGYQGNSSVPYDRGFSDGREDREHGRGWHPRNNGRKYLDGYRAGYGAYGGKHGRRDDDDYRRGGGPYNGPYGNGPYNSGPYNNGPYRNGPYGNGPYGNYPNGSYSNAQRIAYNNGYQEGLGYGAADRNNRHSYRPTYSSTYQKGTNGYNSSMGSETAYKHAYQDGYRAGYDAGYNGRARR